MGKAQNKSKKTPKKSSGSSKRISKNKDSGSKKSNAPKAAKFTKHIELFKNQIDYFRLDTKYTKMGLSTRAIHAGNNADPLHGGVVPSIDLSTTYA